jgi:magnesium-transporting ATPase (P-type)
VFSAKAGCDLGRARNEHPRIGEIPFDSRFKMMATRNQVHGSEVLFLKGAPEVILEQCDTFRAASSASKLTPELRLRILSLAHEMAESALRVLAFARIDEGFEHRDLTFENLPKKAIFLGLIGQMDPPRSEVAQAVKETEAAGIKTVMITGDHQATGAAIASMLGIKGNQDEVIDGPSLQLMSDRALRERIERIRVFARVLPAQKLRIIEAFQHRGHIVAMTGDGVNDAPALVKADVGVSMGITGTEVAKEAAKIVISDDNFATLVAAVGEGRLVHQNIKKLLLFLFVTSLDEVAILFLALLFGYPVPLAAVQILWINLVTEGTLTLNLIMEPAEGNEMRRPPVPKDEALLDPALLRRIPLMVLSSVGSTFGWMIYRTHEGAPLDLVRTETFTMLAVCQWFNVLNCRSAIQSAISSDLLKNPWLIGGLVLGNLLHLAVIYWPPLQGLFHTVPIEGSMFLAIAGVASLVLWVEEFRKLRVRRALTEKILDAQG